MLYHTGSAGRIGGETQAVVGIDPKNGLELGWGNVEMFDVGWVKSLTFGQCSFTLKKMFR